MCNSFVTLDELEAACAQQESPCEVQQTVYHPVKPHIFFFTLVWSQKQRQAFRIENNQLIGLCADKAQECIALVARHLGLWGEVVSGLQRNDEHEWFMAYEQVYRALYHYNCSEQLKEDAYHDAQIKILEILRKIPTAQQVYINKRIEQLVIEEQERFKNIYDFGSPFYNWAKTIAQNELNQMLNLPRTEPLPPDDSPDVPVVLPQLGSEAEFDEAIERLGNRFKRMLAEIEKLTSKPRQVIYTTLAARQQLWIMLEVLGIESVQAIPAKIDAAGDSEIAKLLDMKENSVRVHRANALRTITTSDPELGDLLRKLMNPHLY